jgi:preprotein translocase SecE subunit
MGGGSELAVAGAGGGGAAEKPPVRMSPTPPEGQGPASLRSWGWGGNFIRESIAELRKVEWPGQSQVVQGTVVVIIACVIIGSYLYLCDQLFSKLVSKVLLGQ